jgi:hypothetical protein
MFDHTHYVPILKGKQGEFASLEQLSGESKSRLTPVIEAFLVNKRKKKIESECKRLKKVWGENRAIFLDVYRPNEEDNADSVALPLGQYLEAARKIGLQLIPVTGLRRSPSFQSVIKNAVKTDALGVCFRLEPTDLGSTDVGNKAKNLARDLKVSESDIDLLLDFREIPLNQISILPLTVKTILKSFPAIKTWRTLTLVATTFPTSMGAFTSRTITPRLRGEWAIWTNLNADRSLSRTPTYGDYGIQNPFLMEGFDFRIMDMTANIRYTREAEWIIFKGAGIKKIGREQIRSICRAVIRHAAYCGVDHCAGDNYINECAAGRVPVGVPATWRRVGTTHHLTFVVNQLSNLLGS